jgi:hypothetical protein
MQITARSAFLPGLVLGLALVLAAPASAQFTQFTWTLDDSEGGLASLTADTMALHGFESAFPGAEITYTTSSDVAGRVRVSSWVLPTDGVCGGNTAFKVVGANHYTYAFCNFDGPLQFDVLEQQQFGFGLRTASLGFPFSNFVTEFDFDAYWRDLGNALAGASGTPALTGTGIVQPGQLVGLSLTDAAPSAPAALFLGFSPAYVPFKGGVLVPSPDLIITGLSTSPTGSLLLNSTLPPNTPVGFAFLAQFWVVDAGGPAGFSASNAMVAAVLP